MSPPACTIDLKPEPAGHDQININQARDVDTLYEMFHGIDQFRFRKFQGQFGLSYFLLGHPERTSSGKLGRLAR